MRLAIVLLVVFPTLAGCVKRTISISSNPNGAIVWVNDREVGRTPIKFEFLYYGEYDVRLEREGYEPIMTTVWALAPWWDAPIIDMVAEVVSSAESRIVWEFDLEPRNDDPAMLLDRATKLRSAALEIDTQ